jgi:hypothetical protein
MIKMPKAEKKEPNVKGQSTPPNLPWAPCDMQPAKGILQCEPRTFQRSTCLLPGLFMPICAK